MMNRHILLASLMAAAILNGASLAETDAIRIQDGLPVPVPDVTPNVTIDFSAKNWNSSTIQNYNGLVTFDFNGQKDGRACLLLTANPNRKPGDSAWSMESNVFPFNAKGVCAITLSVCSTFDLKTCQGTSYRNELVWLDEQGESLGILPLRFFGSASSFRDFRTEGIVPPGTAAFKVRLGFDTPNFLKDSVFACSRLTLSMVKDAPAVPRSRFVTAPFRSGNGSISWNAELPGKSAIAFQVSTADDNAGKPGKWTPFSGPAGTNSRYTAPFTVKAPWVRFAIYLNADGRHVPLLRELNVGGCIETRWSARPDVLSPVITNLTATPTDNPKTPLRFKADDFSAIDWSTLTVKVDGKDITSSITRNGFELNYLPKEPWSQGVHKIDLTLADSAGNMTQSQKVLLLGSNPDVPNVTLRRDGIPLIDGKPFFPVGIFDVCRREFNGMSFDKAVTDLHDAGFNFIHTYRHRDPDFYKMLDKAHELGMKVWVTPSNAFSQEFRQRRPHPAIIGWYVGDDTSRHTTPALLMDSHDRCRSMDNRRLSIQADTVHADEEKSCYEDFVPCTDVFMPEIYPVWADMDADRDRSVPKTFRDMRRCFEDIAKYPGLPTKGVWPILQQFKGWDGWKRYPDRNELRAMTYGVIVQGAGGVTWYTYGGFPDPKTNVQTNFGVTGTKQSWEDLTSITRELAELQPVLVAERTLAQPVPAIVSGPAKDMFEAPSITCMLKDSGNERVLIAVNGVRQTVRASFALPDTAAEGAVLFENRRVTLAKGTLTDTFEPYAVHVYRFPLNAR